MNGADEQPFRVDKVVKRGLAGKDSSPNQGFSIEQQRAHGNSPTSLALPETSFEVKHAGQNHGRPSRVYENWVPKGYILAIISLLSIFALSGSFMFAHSVAGTPALDESYSVSYMPLPKQGLQLEASQTSDSTLSSMPERSETQRTVLDDSVSSSEQESSDVADLLHHQPEGCDARSSRLKVFMYDLPPEFHYGMIAQRPYAAGQIWPRNVTDIPAYPGGLYQQHSPEYWLTSDLLTSNYADRKSTCTAFRVSDWKAADVLFVPFFASLSYNKYSKVDRKEEVDKNEELQEKLVKYLKRQTAWQTSGGYDHVIVIHHPNSMHVMRDQLRNAMFVLADFGRYSSEVANLDKDIVAPYKHVIPSYTEDPTSFEQRTTLLFFQGAIVRKEGGIIRQKLYELLKGESGVRFATGNTQSNGIRSATGGMRSSKFCLHLAGDTPSSNRLFDAVSSHCVPVIISDEIELPYEDDLDYSEFCLFIKSADALRKNFVIKLLRSFSKVEWTKMSQRLQEVDLHFKYQHPTEPNDAVNMVWKSIARKVPLVKLLLHKQKRYDRSKSRS